MNLKESPVKIGYDQTPTQREHFRQLKETLKERLKTEDNLVIRYVNGCPKIVKKLKNGIIQN